MNEQLHDPEKCKWIKQWEREVKNFYTRSCGEGYFYDPTAEGLEYCPYCGKEIEVEE